MFRHLSLFQFWKDEFVNKVYTVARIWLNFKLNRWDAFSDLQTDFLDEIMVKLEEHKLEMVVEKVVQNCENLSVNFFVSYELLVVTGSDHLDY